jgi:hypothetical protein
MDDLRRARDGRHILLQAPVVELEAPGGRCGTLVLTAHLGEPSYFAALRERVAAIDAPVYFEAVRAITEEPAHWQERYHRFLRRLREDIYAGVSRLGVLAFQGQELGPEPGWISADVTCCELADELRRRNVSLFRYELALELFGQIVARAERGDPAARKGLELALRGGLLAISFSFLFEAARLMPGTREFHAVIDDWRSAAAVRRVMADCPRSFVLVYGAAHGHSLRKELLAHGYRERRRSWHTVLRF